METPEPGLPPAFYFLFMAIARIKLVLLTD